MSSPTHTARQLLAVYRPGRVRTRIDPAGQRDAADRHDQQGDPAAPPQDRIEPRVRHVDRGQGAGQFAPLIVCHPA
jgi:hypothetical protein